MLVQALESIIGQTFQNFEIIVINDGGIDVQPLTQNLTSRFNIQYLSHDKNRGVSAARNSGLKIAKGKYIAYLDDDDVFFPEHLETLLSFLEKSPYRVAYTGSYFTQLEKKDGEYVAIKSERFCAIDFNPDQILVKNITPPISFMHERSCLDRVGLFDEQLLFYEDMDLWIRLSRKYKFAHINKVTCEYRHRYDAVSITKSKQDDSLKFLKIIYNKYNKFAKNKPDIIKSQRKVMAKTLIRLGRYWGRYKGLYLLTQAIYYDPFNRKIWTSIGEIILRGFKKIVNVRPLTNKFIDR
jgi:glycosyltransferase involved in cell wall biosynthesis